MTLPSMAAVVTGAVGQSFTGTVWVNLYTESTVGWCWRAKRETQERGRTRLDYREAETDRKAGLLQEDSPAKISRGHRLQEQVRPGQAGAGPAGVEESRLGQGTTAPFFGVSNSISELTTFGSGDDEDHRMYEGDKNGIDDVKKMAVGMPLMSTVDVSAICGQGGRLLCA